MGKSLPPGSTGRGVQPLSVIGGTEFWVRAGRAQGDLLQSGAEVLVIPADTGYVMRGGLGRRVRAQGGSTIAAELRAHKPLSPGDVVMTDAGRLSARYVFHAVISSWSAQQPGRRTDQKVLQATLWRAVSRCVSLAQLMGLSSLAFPSLGTGSARADRFESGSTLAAACLDALQPDGSLGQILFCFDNAHSARIFRTAFLQQRLMRQARGLAVRDARERERLGANLTRIWRTLMKMNADVETLAAVVRALEAKPSAGVINLTVGDIINSNAIAIGERAEAIFHKGS